MYESLSATDHNKLHSYMYRTCKHSTRERIWNQPRQEIHHSQKLESEMKQCHFKYDSKTSVTSRNMTSIHSRRVTKIYFHSSVISHRKVKNCAKRIKNKFCYSNAFAIWVRTTYILVNSHCLMLCGGECGCVGLKVWTVPSLHRDIIR